MTAKPLKILLFATVVVLLIAFYWVHNQREAMTETRTQTFYPTGQASQTTSADEISVTVCEEAKRAVRSRLKAPTTAKFPGCVWGRQEYEIRADPAQKTFWVFGHVDSQNVFGAMLRQKWGVKLNHANASGRGEWKVVSVDFE